MNAIVSTLLTHHKKRFKTIIEAKIVIEKKFQERDWDRNRENFNFNQSFERSSNRSQIECWNCEIKNHYAQHCKRSFKDDQKKAINRRNLRRSNSNRSRKDYQTYVHHDDFIFEHRIKNDSSYDRLWCNVQFHSSNEDQEISFAKNRRYIVKIEDAERHFFQMLWSTCLKNKNNRFVKTRNSH
jgi:hypothetical protein